MGLGDGVKEEAVPSHGVHHARGGNHEGGEAACDAENDDGGKNDGAGLAEEDFSGLSDEGGGGADLFDGYQVNEDGADDDVDRSDGQDSEDESARHGAGGVANFAGDFGGVPPAAERKESGDDGGGERGAERERSGADGDEGHEIGPRAEVKREGPDGEGSEDSKFEPGKPAENSGAECRAENIQSGDGGDGERGGELH